MRRVLCGHGSKVANLALAPLLCGAPYAGSGKVGVTYGAPGIYTHTHSMCRYIPIYFFSVSYVAVYEDGGILELR